METARRVATLPGERRLVVRRATAADADGIAALFEGLSPDDRHLRFFSADCPDRHFVDELVELDRGRGVALVATVDDEVVAEADFHVQSARPDPELSITVAEPWRGWLGAYLLDALLEEAAEAGHPNLEAEVLLANRRMLGLLRSRGYAVVDHPGCGTVRLVVGAADSMPRWDASSERIKVLVEVRGGHWAWTEELRERGFDVLACPGPQPGREDRCPVLRGEPCALAAGADAIVTSLPRDDETTVRIVDAHRAMQPAVPVCVPESREAVEAFLLTIGARAQAAP